MAQAYLYIRFSNSDQREGNSYDRQVDKAKQFCQKNGYDLVEEFLDDGVSGFTGANRLYGRMGEFIGLVDQGKIAPGSVLIIENFDRFSRERPLTSLDTLRHILDRGLTIHVLDQNLNLDSKNLNDFAVFLPLVEMIRSNQESRRKSGLLGSAWAAKKKNAATKVLTRRVPLWLEVQGDGKEKAFAIKPIPERAKIVKRIFKLAAEGYGAVATTRLLNKEKVPTFGKSSFWHVSYVKKILGNPATYGVYQPFKRSDGKRQKDGQQLEGYFPEIISKQEFLAVQTHRQDRTDKGGRGKNTGKNLFSSLVLCGKCGGKMSFADKGSGWVYFVCHKARNGGDCAYHSIRYRDLEARILAKLPDLLGFKENQVSPAEDQEVIALRNKLFGVREAMKNLLDLAEQGKNPIPELNDRINARKREQDKLEAEINRKVGLHERQKVETSTRTELKRNILEILEGDFKGVLANKGDSERLRLKLHLAKIIKKIEIHHAYLPSGERIAWWPQIHLKNGQYIDVLGSAETEIYTRWNKEKTEEEES